MVVYKLGVWLTCCRMDKEHKGFLLPNDWGRPEFSKVVEFFSMVYMQKYMGLPGPTSTPDQVMPRGLTLLKASLEDLIGHVHISSTLIKLSWLLGATIRQMLAAMDMHIMVPPPQSSNPLWLWLPP